MREPVAVRISRDELVVLSHPGPDRSVRLEQLRTGKVMPRLSRNHRIGEFLKELKFIEGRSTGIRKIIRAMNDNGSPPAKFEVDDDRAYFHGSLGRAARRFASGDSHLIRGPAARTALIQSSSFRVRSALARTSRTGGRDRTARQQASREPDGFFRSEHQAWNLPIDDRECHPSSVPGIDLGLIGVVPAIKQRLLSLPVLEIAVVAIRVVSVDLRRFFTADVMIRDRKQRCLS